MNDPKKEALMTAAVCGALAYFMNARSPNRLTNTVVWGTVGYIVYGTFIKPHKNPTPILPPVVHQIEAYETNAN